MEVFLQARLRGRLLYVISSHCSQLAHEPQGTSARVNYFTNDPLWENQAVEQFPNLSPPLILPLPSSPPRYSSNTTSPLTSFFPSLVFKCFCDVQLMLHRSLPIKCSAPCLTSYIYIWPWSTKPVTSNTAIFVAIANKTLYCIDFSIMSKIIMILYKDHVPWRYFVNVLLQIYKYLIFDY